MNAQHWESKLCKSRERLSEKAIMVFIKGADMICYLPGGIVHEVYDNKHKRYRLQVDLRNVDTVKDIIAAQQLGGYTRMK
ncbi:MAG TPA: hypothetical protein VL854_09755 [Nitrososphaeraceae archaeon]|nr:hypothetical protein [Nitrososphaeraceae archaeon]